MPRSAEKAIQELNEFLHNDIMNVVTKMANKIYRRHRSRVLTNKAMERNG